MLPRLFRPLLALLLLPVPAALGQAALEIPFTFSDGASSRELRAGLDATATAGLDLALGEQELPPMPPVGSFEARFVSAGGAASLGQGSYRDYRTGTATFAGEVVHQVQWQLGSGSGLTVSYVLPAGVTARVQDLFGGVVLNQTIAGTGQFSVANSALTQAKITMVYTGGAPANRPPVFTSTALTTATAGTAYSYSATATDADGNALTLTAPTLPSWLVFTAGSGGTATLSGTPTAAGSYPVVLRASDGTATTEQSFTVVVSAPANRAPVFTSTAVTTGTVGTAYSYGATATDADGNAITLTAPTRPAWLTFTDSGSGSGTLTGTPTAAGSYTVVLRASDGTATTEQSFTIVVTAPANRPPVFTSTALTTATAGTAYSYAVTATDADGNALTLTAPTRPAWLTFADNGSGSGSGTLSGTPTAAGSYTVVLRASDGTATAEQSFTVVVSAPANRAPVFGSTAPTTATTGTAYSYAVTATDADGNALTLTAPTLPSWLTFTAGSGGTATLSGTPTVAGSYPVVLRASDGTATTEQAFTIGVTAPQGPSANIDLVFTLSDGVASRELRAGLDPRATAGLDAALGEAELPPSPPTGIFDARFVSLANVAVLGQGAYRDYRTGSCETPGPREHQMRWQLGSGSGLTISYALPAGVTARVQDLFGGVVLNQAIEGSGQLTISNALLTQASLTITYPRCVGLVRETAALPEAYALQPPSPNPVRHGTTVSIGVPVAAPVRVAVYDLQGRQVGLLVDEVLAPGTYRYAWDPGTLASGMYLVRLEAGGTRSVQRLSLVR